MTPKPTLPLEDLKKKALAATPGPWIRLGDSIDGYNTRVWRRDDFSSCGVPDILICEVYGVERNEVQRASKRNRLFLPDPQLAPNIEFIVSFSPDVVLDLIARVENLEAVLREVQETLCESTCGELKHRPICTAVKDALEKRGTK